MSNVCRCDPGLLILKTDLLSLCHPELKRARAGEVGLGSWELHAWCTLQDCGSNAVTNNTFQPRGLDMYLQPGNRRGTHTSLAGNASFNNVPISIV